MTKKVWAVFGDNGERYAEDQNHWLMAVFTTQEKAENYQKFLADKKPKDDEYDLTYWYVRETELDPKFK